LILRCFFTQIYIPAEYISERKIEREREEEGEGERNKTTVVPYILAMVLLAAYRAGGWVGVQEGGRRGSLSWIIFYHHE
jgi:hypothetical protein